MSARVAFALSRNYTPSYEAVSREISALRVQEAAVLGILPLRGNPLRHRLEGEVLSAHPLAMRVHPWTRRRLRGAKLLHVFAPLPLPRRLHWLPRVEAEILTAIALPERPNVAELDRFDFVVAECRRDHDRLLAAGISPQRLRCIEPFADSSDPPLPTGAFCVGFASWPFLQDEAHARGLDLIAAAARELPEIRFRIALRPESQVDARSFESLDNVQLIREALAHPDQLWAPTHAALAVFRGGKSKSVPNSILEAIAAGRPAIVGEAVGLSEELAAAGAAIRIPPDADSLRAALLRLQSQYDSHVRAAREFRPRFSRKRFHSDYARLYEERI